MAERDKRDIGLTLILDCSEQSREVLKVVQKSGRPFKKRYEVGPGVPGIETYFGCVRGYSNLRNYLDMGCFQ